MAEVRRMVGAEAALAVVILGLGVFLTSAGLSMADRWKQSAVRRQSFLFDDLLGLLALAAGLAVVIWWLLSLAAAFASALLDRTGHHAAARATGRCSPVFMRRLAMAAVGIQLLGAPLAHADPLPAAGPPSGSGSSLSAAWAPLTDRQPTRSVGHSTTPGTPERPVAADGSRLEPQWKPRVPVVEPGLVTSLPARSTAAAAGAHPVPVRAGESLWTIAARELGEGASDMEVAARWPQWYEANRSVIGADPSVLLPGQLLNPPPP